MTIRDALAHTPNLREPFPGFFTGGQPSESDFQAAQAAGLGVVIDTRDPMEPRPCDEARTLAGLGMTYLNVPVVSGAVDDQVLDEFLAAVRAHDDAPLLIHCASGNRVAGALIPYLILDRKMAEQEAVDAAMGLGLRSAELLELGLDYARRKQG